MNIFTSNHLRIFKKRSHQQVIVFVLVTLVYNFFVFPVHAATETSNTIFTNDKDIQIIKSPESEIYLRERLLTNNSEIPSLIKNQDNRSEFAKDFKIIALPTPPTLMSNFMPVSSNTFKIATNSESSEQAMGMAVTLTAYNSEVAQTDGDPCTTANGFNVCKHGIEDTVAANFLPMGTKIMVPELFGDKIFTVRDRTSNRFKDRRTDIWMLKRSDALKFGIRHARIIIVE